MYLFLKLIIIILLVISIIFVYGCCVVSSKCSEIENYKKN